MILLLSPKISVVLPSQRQNQMPHVVQQGLTLLAHSLSVIFSLTDAPASVTNSRPLLSSRQSTFCPCHTTLSHFSKFSGVSSSHFGPPWSSFLPWQQLPTVSFWSFYLRLLHTIYFFLPGYLFSKLERALPKDKVVCSIHCYIPRIKNALYTVKSQIVIINVVPDNFDVQITIPN